MRTNKRKMGGKSMRKLFSWVSLLAVATVLVLSSGHFVTAQSTTPSQALEISPPLVEVNTDPGKTEKFEIRLRNLTSTELVARADVNDFAAQGEEGQPAVLLDDKEPYPYSLKDWVGEIPPLHLAPQEQGVVEVTLHIPADASPGGHYGVVRFTALPPELEDTGVSLSASLGTLVLANVSGDVTKQLSVEEFFASRGTSRGSFFEYGPLNFTARLKNEGSVHLKPTGTIEIKNILGRKVATLAVNESQRNVLPASIRRFDQTLNKKWLFGRYSATLNLTYGDNQTVQSTIHFWVLPYKLMAIVLSGLILLIVLIFFLSRRYRRRVMKKAKAELERQNSSGDGDGSQPTTIMPEPKEAEEPAKKSISVDSENKENDNSRNPSA